MQLKGIQEFDENISTGKTAPKKWVEESTFPLESTNYRNEPV